MTTYCYLGLTHFCSQTLVLDDPVHQIIPENKSGVNSLTVEENSYKNVDQESDQTGK